MARSIPTTFEDDSLRSPSIAAAMQATAGLCWPSVDYSSFEAACHAAVEQNRTLNILDESVTRLEEPIKLKKNGQFLRIIGTGSAIIEAVGLGAFVVGGRRTTLELEGLMLRHLAPATCDKVAETGGAVFIMGSAAAKLANVTVSSQQGLGIWMVQDARLVARNCHIRDVGRSGCALFGGASAVFDNCLIERCAIHGACARGETKLVLNFCEVVECGQRGVYGYQSNKLTMYRCLVRGTKDPSRAAVEVAGAREGDDVHACITSCRIHTNAGLNIRLCGAVKHILEDNSYSGGGCGDLLIACGDVNGVWPSVKVV